MALLFLAKDYSQPDTGTPGSYCNEADTKWGSCIGVGGDWSIGGYGRRHCPSGYSYTGESTAQGCVPFFKQGKCVKTSFSKSKAHCCLKEDNSKECPVGYCRGKQDSTNCKTEIKNHCKNNMRSFDPLAEECWEWSFNNDLSLINDYCAGNNGARVSTDKRCNALAKDPKAHGKMDKAVKAYCTKTQIARAKRRQGESICNCFLAHVPEDDLMRDLGEQGVPECWYRPCQEDGYKTQEMIDRVQSGCGDLCPQILKDSTFIGEGDLNITANCGDVPQNDQPPDSQTSPSDRTPTGEPLITGDGIQIGENRISLWWLAVPIGLLFLVIGLVVAFSYKSKQQYKSETIPYSYYPQEQQRGFMADPY